jgi:pantetheine-phosphate adenylyltransferase
LHIAVYPGSFDPLTNGHLDIIHRARNIFDKLIIAVAINSKKQSLFSIEERQYLIKEVVGDLDRIEITSFTGLTIDFCEKHNAKAIIRGLRAVTDFDYESAISLMNKKLAPEIETVFLVASAENSFISSSIVKEVAARHGREVPNHVPQVVNTALINKFKELQNKG